MRIDSTSRIIVSAVLALAVAACTGSGPTTAPAAPRVAPTAAASAATGASPAAPSPSADPTVYKLQVLLVGASFYTTPFQAMIDEGIAAKHGLDLSLAQFNSGGGSTSTVFAGGTGDILVGGIDTVAAIGASGGLDVTVLGTWTDLNYFRLSAKAGSAVKTVADLKGKTVSVSGAGSFSDLSLRALLRKNGLVPDTDVKIVGTGGQSVQLAALESGTVDASMLNPPTTYTEAANIQVIHNFEDDGPMPGTMWTMRTADVQRNATPFVRFMQAYVETIAKMKADPAWATQISNKQWSATVKDPKVIQEMLDEFLTKPGVWTTDGKFTQVDYDNGMNMIVDSGARTRDQLPTFQKLTQYTPQW